MLQLSCAVVARRLEAFHDGELAVEGQIAIENHVLVCSGCTYSLRRLQVIGDALREAAGTDAAVPAEAEGMRVGVVSRHKAEQAESLETRMGEMFEDMHLVWAGLAGTLAIAMSVALVSALVYFASPQRTDSLFGIMRAMASPGSNENPVGLNGHIRFPRVSAETAMPLFFGDVRPTSGEMVFALAGVVTREGRVAAVELLLTDERDGELILQLMDAMSAARFEPASFAGSPVAVNLVWLFTHTTVRAQHAGPEAALPEGLRHRA